MPEAENIENIEQELNDATRLLEGATEEVKEVKATTEEAKEEVVTKEVTDTETKEPLEEEETHGEKSRLGRKVKRLESTLEDIKSTLDFIKERSVKEVKTEPAVEEEEIELSEYPTADEIKRFNEQERKKTLRLIDQRESDKSKKQQEATQQYVKEYSRLLKESVDPDEDPDLYTMLTDEKDLTYNQVYKNDAKEDFLINLRNANKALRSRGGAPVTKTTVANKTTGIPTGVNIPGGTKPAQKVVDISKWSADEQELAKNFSADELASLGIL